MCSPNTFLLSLINCISSNVLKKYILLLKYLPIYVKYVSFLWDFDNRFLLLKEKNKKILETYDTKKGQFCSGWECPPPTSQGHMVSHTDTDDTQRVKIPINKIHFYQSLTLSLKITPSELKPSSSKCFLKLNWTHYSFQPGPWLNKHIPQGNSEFMEWQCHKQTPFKPRWIGP